jgi:pectate lyase
MINFKTTRLYRAGASETTRYNRAGASVAIAISFSLILLISFSSCGKKKYDELVQLDISQIAFPGAEGYGAYSKGGRGGEVYYVTNLNDSGEGSFRYAVEKSGARTVLFAVSGVIELKSLVIIEEPFITIAGQTAPGEGVTFKDCGIYIRTHDVIIRYIKIRPGDSPDGYRFEDRDAITIGEDSYSVIVDHVSASWAIDEIMSTWYEPQQITIQWCILSEALSHAGHPEDEHSKALLVGDKTQKMSIHHNVFAHNNDRCPALIKGGADCDIVNNIIYNWGEFCCSFSIDYRKMGVKANIFQNYFKEGISTTGSFFGTPERNYRESQIYLGENYGDHQELIDFNANPELLYAEYSFLVSSKINWSGNILYSDINDAFETILDSVGATKPIRDNIDTRIIADVRNKTGKIIDSQSEVGGYDGISTIILTEVELLAIDHDLDGIPDSIELANGLNPTDATDRNLDHDSDGFTNLEEFLNGGF